MIWNGEFHVYKNGTLMIWNGEFHVFDGVNNLHIGLSPSLSGVCCLASYDVDVFWVYPPWN